MSSRTDWSISQRLEVNGCLPLLKIVERLELKREKKTQEERKRGSEEKYETLIGKWWVGFLVVVLRSKECRFRVVGGRLSSVL